MAPFFKRNKKTTIAELEEYYATKNKSRPVMAWFMAFLSLVITVVVLIGIFLASRWVYRTIVGNDDATTTTTSTEPGTVALPSYDSDSEGSRGITFEDSTSNNESDLVYGNTGPSRSGDSGSGGGVVDDGAAVIDRSNESTESANTENTNSSTATGDDTAAAELPDTGAGESALVVMVVVALAGYFFSRSRQLR